jgi:hypothetical protein
MNDKKHVIFFLAFFPVFNAMILMIYLVDFDIPSRLLSTFIFVCLFFCVLTIVTVKKPEAIFKQLRNSQITLFTVVLLFLAFEVTSRTFPGLIPMSIQKYIATNRDIKEVQGRMVQFLDESPFEKFKPNTVIRSQGYRGTDKQFVYEWRTDKLGFKNSDELAEKMQVDIVAIGNSFTEGHGVAIEKTWASLLTARGFSTYNLGVQGYAPIQLEGSLRKYGLRLRPKYIIIGYCAGTFPRNGRFGKNGDRYSGLIGEIREQARYFISAVFLLIRNEIFTSEFYNRIKKRIYPEIVVKSLRPYRAEISTVGNRTDDIKQVESESEQWRRTISAFGSIINMAETIGARVILLYLPHRAEMYFSKATGKKLPVRYLEEIEAGKLEQFAKSHDIAFLNPSKRIKDYVDSLPNDSPISKYPYLEVDGHMSNCGHAMVAEEILEHLKGDED